MTRSPHHPSGGLFGLEGCEVYTWTRSRGDGGWYVVGQHLDRQCWVASVAGEQPTRQPVVDAVLSLRKRQYLPFRAVLLRAHDEADAVEKALRYIRRVDHHEHGLDTTARRYA